LTFGSFDLLAVPQPLVFGQVITDPMANNGEPFVYEVRPDNQLGRDGTTFELLEDYKARWGIEGLVQPDRARLIMPKYVYMADEVLSLRKSTYVAGAEAYLRIEISIERIIAFINWHVQHMGEVWFTRQGSDTLPRDLDDAIIRVMNVHDLWTINNGMREFEWEGGVFYKFVDMEREKREPAIF